MQNLEKSIKQLEVLTDLQTQELVTLRARYNALSVSKAENSLTRLKQTFYEQGEKSGRLLAWQLKKLEKQKELLMLSTHLRVI